MNQATDGYQTHFENGEGESYLKLEWSSEGMYCITTDGITRRAVDPKLHWDKTLIDAVRQELINMGRSDLVLLYYWTPYGQTR